MRLMKNAPIVNGRCGIFKAKGKIIEEKKNRKTGEKNIEKGEKSCAFNKINTENYDG